MAPLLCELTSTFLHLLQSHTQPNQLIVIGIDIATSLIALDPQIHSITRILANLPLYNTTAGTYLDSPPIQQTSTSTCDKMLYTHANTTNNTTTSHTNTSNNSTATSNTNSVLYKLQMTAVYILQCIYSQYIQYRKSILLDLIPVYTQVRTCIVLHCIVCNR